MNAEDPLEKNIRRSVGLRALRQIGNIVDKENASEAASLQILRWLLHYGWIILLIIVALLAHLIGVY